jgi:hypothetical protein
MTGNEKDLILRVSLLDEATGQEHSLADMWNTLSEAKRDFLCHLLRKLGDTLACFGPTLLIEETPHGLCINVCDPSEAPQLKSDLAFEVH